MTPFRKFGAVSILCIPLSVSAGATLEDIQDNATQTGGEISNSESAEQVNALPELAASAPVDENRQARQSGGSESLLPGVDTPPTFQLYTSDKAAEFAYQHNGPVFGLNNDRAVVSFLLNEERDNALTASIMFEAAPEFVEGLELSFGPKLIAGLLSIENADVIGFAANLEAVYSAPIKQFPLRLSTGFSYAPDVLTFGQSDRIIDWNVRAGLPLTNNIHGFVGGRYLQFDTRPGERKLDQQIHFGIRWSGK